MTLIISINSLRFVKKRLGLSKSRRKRLREKFLPHSTTVTKQGILVSRGVSHLNISYKNLLCVRPHPKTHLLLLLRLVGLRLSVSSSLQPLIHGCINSPSSSFHLWSPLSFLGKILYLTTNPQTKKDEERNSKGD